MRIILIIDYSITMSKDLHGIHLHTTDLFGHYYWLKMSCLQGGECDEHEFVTRLVAVSGFFLATTSMSVYCITIMLACGSYCSLLRCSLLDAYDGLCKFSEPM